MIAERELTEAEAKKRLDLLCEQLGFSMHIKGSPSSRVATCDLKDATGKIISTGAGKGRACQIGSLAESLEHYFLSAPCYNPTTLRSGSDITQNPALRNDAFLRSIPKASRLPTYELTSLDSTRKIQIPALLLTPSPSLARATKNIPSCDYLSKYSSNSGTAIGGTENEALLHAINESIERHVLSHYYLSLCGLTPQPKLYTPSRSFFSETFADDSTLLHHEKHMSLYMTHAFFDVFFCIAVSKKNKKPVLASVGSGCSLDPSVALYRAVTELIQCQALTSSKDLKDDESTLAFLRTSARLSTLINPLPAQTPEPFHPSREKTPPLHQIQKIAANLEGNGHTVFYRNLFNTPGTACVTQVYIPGLERFHLIRSGIPVAPQQAFYKAQEKLNGLL